MTQQENNAGTSGAPARSGTDYRFDPRKKKGNNKKQRVFFHRTLQHIPLPKLLTKARYLSAGLARQYIESGRVRINSRPMLSRFYEVNLRRERVTIDEAPVQYPRRLFYMVYNKTRDVSCISGDEMFDQIFDPNSVWSFPYGRLRRTISGLVIVSNDPRMIATHNRIDEEIQKEYRVRVNKDLTVEQLNTLRIGMRIGDEYLIPMRVDVAGRNRTGMLLDITLLDGSYDGIFIALKQLGCEVLQMRRIRVGLLNETMIPPGEWRELANYEVVALGLSRFMRGELPPVTEERWDQRESGWRRDSGDRDKRASRAGGRQPWRDKQAAEAPEPRPFTPEIGNQIADAASDPKEIDFDERDRLRKRASQERNARRNNARAATGGKGAPTAPEGAAGKSRGGHPPKNQAGIRSGPSNRASSTEEMPENGGEPRDE